MMGMFSKPEDDFFLECMRQRQELTDLERKNDDLRRKYEHLRRLLWKYEPQELVVRILEEHEKWLRQFNEPKTAQEGP